jgi:hypothetical protein
MSSFLDKLIEDTNNGDLDFVWKYNDGSKSYTFVLAKHYLSGMTFSLEKDSELLVFPDGFAVQYSKEDIIRLRDSINLSLERTVETSIRMYITKVSNDVSTNNPTASQPPDSNEQPVDKSKPANKKIIKKSE